VSFLSKVQWTRADEVFRQSPANGSDTRRNPRSRSNTAHSYSDRYNMVDEEPPMPPPESRPSIRSNRAVSSYNPAESLRRELPGVDYSSARPAFNRSTTFEGPTSLHRDVSPISTSRMSCVPSDSLTNRTNRVQLRPIGRGTNNELFGDPSDDSAFNSNSSPDRSYGERSISPATSHGSIPSRTASSTTLNAGVSNGKKPPPPPPPSRAKKPPPPPPIKRSALSTSNVHYA